MPQSIQTPAAGLLNALGITGGTYPRDLADQVLPAIELRDFYRSRQLAVRQDSVTLRVASGTGTSIIVPNGEIWDVLSVGVALTAGSVATQAKADLFIGIDSGGFTTSIASSGPLQTLVANEDVRFGVFTPGLVLNSGARVGSVLTADTVVGSLTVDVRALVAVYTH